MNNQTKKQKKYNNKTRKISYRTFIKFEKEYSKNIPERKLKISNEKINDEYIKLLKKEFHIPKDINPQNNFYGYINYNWLNKTKFNNKFKYITEVDNVRIIQTNVFEQIYNLLNNYIKKNNTTESINLKNFFDSAYKLNSISDSLKNINEYIQYLDELRKDKKNIWKLLAYINKIDMIKIKCPFVWSIVPNPHNSTKFISKISPFIFESLVIYGIKNTSDYRKQLTKNKFNEHVKKLLGSFDEKLSDNSQNVISIALEISDALFCERENEKKNTIIGSDEALKNYNFNWDEFAKELGFTEVPKYFVCENISYLKCGTKLLLDNWDSERWRSFWIWLYVRGLARFTKNADVIFYEYYGKTLKGQMEIRPKKIRCAEYTSVVFNKLVNNLYLDKYVDPIKVDFVENLAEDLKIVFKRIIARNDWMVKKTKDKALEKIDALKFLLVKPEYFSDDPPATIEYKNNELLNNLLKYTYWRTNYLISLVGKNIEPYPSVSWSSYPLKFTSYQTFIVNASYIPTTNTIYIPAAYIQKPFVDLNNRSLGYNLATIGFTIAHELSHSLDSIGQKYDKNGNADDWWTLEDKKVYARIENSILEQYEKWANRDGLKYNAKISINEDVADICGLAICDEFFRDYARNVADSVHAEVAYFKLFFIHFAVNMRQKLVNTESELIINPHPPDKYRCNIPLSRSIIFKTIYNIKKGDKMWWPSNNQVW